LDAQAVYERDEFDYARGTSPFLRHKPARGDRGQVVFYYAVATLTRGEPHFEVLTPGDVKELRRGKVGPNGDIPDPMRWMERKTAVRQVLKPMPKSTMLVRALGADERPGSELFLDRVSERPRMALHSATPASRKVESPPDAEPVWPQDLADMPDPESPPADDVSKRQLRKLGTQFTKFGVKDRDERLRIVSAITGRSVESSAELSLDEASTLIDTLDGVLAAAAKNGDDPLEQLLLIVGDAL
jgi:recombination protein RecT